MIAKRIGIFVIRNLSAFFKFETKNMKQLTINISENNYQTFLDFIKTLDYVEIPEAENNILTELQESLKQVKMMQDGKMEKQSAEDFLNEL